jgi:antibiotic biosynthesis monooxygenase (ABM) superfamily enzyme
MVIRIWHGWTSPESADAYENLLKTEVFEGIAKKSIAGYQKIELMRRNVGDEVEFVTMMRFSSLNDVRGFVGEDYEQAYVPAAARKILKRFDQRAQHYELRETIDYASNAGTQEQR